MIKIKKGQEPYQISQTRMGAATKVLKILVLNISPLNPPEPSLPLLVVQNSLQKIFLFEVWP